MKEPDTGWLSSRSTISPEKVAEIKRKLREHVELFGQRYSKIEMAIAHEEFAGELRQESAKSSQQ